MLATTRGATWLGIDAHPIEIETELSQGLPNFSIIGLGDTAVQEARYRILAALRTSELTLPHKRVTINLAPAAQRKDGAALDLAMALGLLVAAGLLSEAAVDGALALGELALSGALRPVRGILPAAELARRLGCSRIIVPVRNGAEAAAIKNLEVVAAPDLAALVAHLRGHNQLPRACGDPRPLRSTAGPDLSDVRGQLEARRALEIAAAGGHNILLLGTPGSGKTMLARRLPSILPNLDEPEQLAVTRIRSVAGLTEDFEGLVRERPFRCPHHSISMAGLVGGGTPIRPGEVTLAHAGVLFLDEMPEVPRRVLDSLRQPLEDKHVTIVRARQSVRLPAAFMLVGAANPCPCGWMGHPSGRCSCRAEEIERYAGRLSGPLLDRIDLVVEAPALSAQELLEAPQGESSAQVKERVHRARLRMRRQGCENARLEGRELRSQIVFSPPSRRLLEASVDRLGISARSLDRVLRVARTVADLDDSDVVSDVHVAEALRYRRPLAWGTR